MVDADSDASRPFGEPESPAGDRMAVPEAPPALSEDAALHRGVEVARHQGEGGRPLVHPGAGDARLVVPLLVLGLQPVDAPGAGAQDGLEPLTRRLEVHVGEVQAPEGGVQGVAHDPPRSSPSPHLPPVTGGHVENREPAQEAHVPLGVAVPAGGRPEVVPLALLQQYDVGGLLLEEGPDVVFIPDLADVPADESKLLPGGSIGRPPQRSPGHVEAAERPGQPDSGRDHQDEDAAVGDEAQDSEQEQRHGQHPTRPEQEEGDRPEGLSWTVHERQKNEQGEDVGGGGHPDQVAESRPRAAASLRRPRELQYRGGSPGGSGRATGPRRTGGLHEGRIPASAR